MVAELKTVPEIEAERGIDRNTLHYWIKNGLPHIKRGRVVFIDPDVLDDFMARRVRKKEMYVLLDENAKEPE